LEVGQSGWGNWQKLAGLLTDDLALIL